MSVVRQAGKDSYETYNADAGRQDAEYRFD
jgi:hypothetical protein